MLRITNVEVTGLAESISASGYPKSVKIDNTICSNDEFRAQKLGRTKQSSGHDCFLKGVVVQFDVTYPEYWSPQFQRYHFADIVSSQSKMHMILEFDVATNCNKYVDPVVIEIVNEYKRRFNTAKDPEERYKYFMKIISNLPMGFEKTMRVVTNYLQLKTIYSQRKDHKLKEDWGAFCGWILTLPLFQELTGCVFAV